MSHSGFYLTLEDCKCCIHSPRFLPTISFYLTLEDCKFV
nr:MAG TPA_asm: hypothetical protein [Caudoviricetes sp.]